MPYLIRTHDDQLLLLNNSGKNGLYLQTLSAGGLSRPLIIQRTNTSSYSASIDHNQDLHIVIHSSSQQIIHLHYKNNNMIRNTILEDPKDIYHFSDIFTLYANENTHLFYTANKPIGDLTELIHHILCKENKNETHPILSFAANPLGFRYMTYNNHIYLLYCELSTHYSLHLMIYKDDRWSEPLSVASSSFPIDDFQFCSDQNGRIHMVYVQERYGRYHLIYKKNENDKWTDEIVLHTSSAASQPTIFTYHHGLWVNFLDNGQLQMILSMDHGNSFSKNVDCSLKTSDLEPCNFISGPNVLPSSFNCNRLYASLFPPVRAGIISNIDMIKFHPDLEPNTELELFLDGLFHSFSSAKTAPDYSIDLANLQAENQELRQIQEQMVSQYNDMAELTKKIQEEGKKWRDKALSLTGESQIDG